MTRYLPMLIAAMVTVLPSCSRDSGENPYDSTDFNYEMGLRHDEIILGDRLENPYKVENVEKAYASLYPTKARVEIETTNLYVRFLPADEQELELLSGLELTDHPLDYAIAREGDWYHDPEVEDDSVTWMYAVVDKDYVFPDVRYEVIDNCFLSENRTVTRSDDGIDWEEVLRESYRITGNGAMLSEPTRAGGMSPSGRISIVDPDFSGGKPIGVSGVKVVCNSFVRFASSFTDIDGYYSMDKSFTSDIRYRIVFKNSRSFALGFNFILVPASVSTLGKSSPAGVNVTVTRDSDDKLFRRCAVSNGAYDFIGRCTEEDLGIAPPPQDVRIWLFPDMEPSAAMMLHHGAVLDNAAVASWMGVYSQVFKFFLPDITIGCKGKEDYMDFYSATCHELAHACHFNSVGKQWWDRYIMFIATSFLSSGGQTYGTGSEKNAGLCEVSEMWAYYIQSKVHKDRYGGNMPSYGTSWWFFPQIFKYLDERGMSSGDIFKALVPEVVDRNTLKLRLQEMYPARKEIVEQVFSRYEY